MPACVPVYLIVAYEQHESVSSSNLLVHLTNFRIAERFLTEVEPASNERTGAVVLLEARTAGREIEQRRTPRVRNVWNNSDCRNVCHQTTRPLTQIVTSFGPSSISCVS